MLPHCRGFLLLRNAPIEPDLIFLSKAVDVESQCITFASLPHLCVFGVECREIASAKFLADQKDTDEMAMTFEVGGRKSGFGRETFIKAMTESGVGEKVAAKKSQGCAHARAYIQ